MKNANPDVAFIYLNEEESARMLKELRKADVKAPLVGETTLIGQKVIELAGDAANGAIAPCRPDDRRAHSLHQGVPRQVRRQIPLRARSQRHQGLSRRLYDQGGDGEDGQARSEGSRRALHGLTITADKEPGILMDVTIDENGDLDRESFLGEVVDGKQVIKEVLPKLH